MKYRYTQWDRYIQEKELRRTFRKYDRDNNGTLDFYEFRRAMKQISGMEMAEIEALFNEMDVDGNHVISIDGMYLINVGQ